MASGTVDPSTPSGVQGSSAAAVSDRQSRDEFPENEKRTVASAGRQTQRHPNPFVITERPEEKQLTIASRQLSVRDFTLLKTLGTGEFRRLITMWRASNGGISFAGTFARVWLARFRDEKTSPEKVYALKILRKADGTNESTLFHDQIHG